MFSYTRSHRQTIMCTDIILQGSVLERRGCVNEYTFPRNIVTAPALLISNSACYSRYIMHHVQRGELKCILGIWTEDSL